MRINRYEFGGLLFSLNYEFSRLERSISKRAGLFSGQPRVITILKDNEGCTLSELSELCGIGLPSLSVSVRNMEKSGLIRKGSSERDNRAQLLYLTEEGHEKAVAFHEAIDAFHKRLIRELGAKGTAEVGQRFKELAAYIKKVNESGKL